MKKQTKKQLLLTMLTILALNTTGDKIDQNKIEQESYIENILTKLYREEELKEFIKTLNQTTNFNYNLIEKIILGNYFLKYEYKDPTTELYNFKRISLIDEAINIKIDNTSFVFKLDYKAPNKNKREYTYEKYSNIEKLPENYLIEKIVDDYQNTITLTNYYETNNTTAEVTYNTIYGNYTYKFTKTLLDNHPHYTSIINNEHKVLTEKKYLQIIGLISSAREDKNFSSILHDLNELILKKEDSFKK